MHGLPPPPSLISGPRFPFGARPGFDPFAIASMQRKLSMAQHPAQLKSESPTDSPRPLQHNMYEMATMQNEVNTQEMVVRVKGLLAENNIAQKVNEIFKIPTDVFKEMKCLFPFPGIWQGCSWS